MNRSKLYRKTFEAILEFARLQLWDDFENADFLAFDVPGEPHLVIGSIMGAGGIKRGLQLTRGVSALQDMLGMLRGGTGNDVVAIAKMQTLGFSLNPLADVPVDFREFLKEAGFHGLRTQIVPYLIAKDSGKHSRGPRRAEVELLLWVLRGISTAHARGLLEPNAPLLPPHELTVLHLQGDPLDPEVRLEIVSVDTGSLQEWSAEIELPLELRNLSPSDEHWYVALPSLPYQIEGDDRQVLTLFVVDASSERIVGLGTTVGGLEGACESLFEILGGGNEFKRAVLPATLTFTSSLMHHRLAPLFEEQGVQVNCEPHVPLLEKITADLEKHLSGEVPVSTAGFDKLPGNDDLLAWKRDDERLHGEFAVRTASNMKSGSDRVRFFGQANLKGLSEERWPMALMALSYWLMFFDSSSKKIRAQKMLSEIHPPEYRYLIKSMLEAHPSIYRVVGIVPGQSLLLEDVLLGGQVRVHDRMFSESAVVGLSVCLVVYRAGDYHFPVTIGPHMGVSDTPVALSFLRDQGLRFERQALIEKAHLFGRLWFFMEHQDRGVRPRLQNYDGDEVHPHTLTYDVLDGQAARTALSGHKHMEADPGDPDGFVWQGKARGTKSASLGEKILLGRLQFVNDELLVEVNSAGRGERVRTLLEAVPGIRYRCVSSTDLEELMAKGPSHDEVFSRRKRTPLPPEVMEQLREQLMQKQLSWLDQSIPALNGLTPRQAAKTAEGRAHVAALVRSFPVPTGPETIPFPRQEVMRELGIEDSL